MDLDIWSEVSPISYDIFGNAVVLFCISGQVVKLYHDGIHNKIKHIRLLGSPQTGNP